MKVKIYILLIYFFMATGVLANNVEQQWGQVNLYGVINGSACEIATESQEQIFEIDNESISSIFQLGHGVPKNFSIKLINCSIHRASLNSPLGSGFLITFEGDSDNEAFKINGNAKGIALQIIDSYGNVIMPGKVMNVNETVASDSIQLNYIMKVISNDEPLKIGTFFSSVRFKLEYY